VDEGQRGEEDLPPFAVTDGDEAVAVPGREEVAARARFDAQAIAELPHRRADHARSLDDGDEFPIARRPCGDSHDRNQPGVAQPGQILEHERTAGFVGRQGSPGLLGPQHDPPTARGCVVAREREAARPSRAIRGPLDHLVVPNVCERSVRLEGRGVARKAERFASKLGADLDQIAQLARVQAAVGRPLSRARQRVISAGRDREAAAPELRSPRGHQVGEHEPVEAAGVFGVAVVEDAPHRAGGRFVTRYQWDADPGRASLTLIVAAAQGVGDRHGAERDERSDQQPGGALPHG
jgi:hypothetical protein